MVALVALVALVAVAALVALVTAVAPIWPTISAALATATALVPAPLSKAPDVKEAAPVPPFATGKVPVTPVVSGKPVTLVITPLAGVPSAGVTKVGPLDNTTLPEPVEEVTPVPPLATGNVPVVPPSIGKPVALVSVPLEGVPKAGVVSVGLVSVGLVSVLFVSVCVPDSVATVESMATVTAEDPL